MSESTINLVLASENLADSMAKCALHETEHGSGHRAIETVFDAPWPIPKHQERRLLKNAPWKENRRSMPELRVPWLSLCWKAQ